jgi:hypothetical protein
MLVKIRYNHDHDGSDLRWRILINDKEFKMKKVVIETNSFTTKDILDTGEEKYHITVIADEIIFSENNVLILK